MICGTKAGADTLDSGARINKIKHGRQVIETADLETGGVAFYEGNKTNTPTLDAAQWIDAVINDTDPCVLPEQALCVTKILDAIYTSAKTGEPVFFKD